MTQSRDQEAVTIKSLCQHLGYSRQAYYKERKVRAKQAIKHEAVRAKINRVRAEHPRMGGRKLHYCLREELAREGLSLGRDRFFALLKAEDLLVERTRRTARTTDSRHQFGRAPDLLAGGANQSTAPHQVWVSDLTYLPTREGFIYLALITDAWSRKVVGFDVAASLQAEGSQRALGQAIRQLPKGTKGVIHHSDRGGQYCCGAYQRDLQRAQIRCSTTQDGNCYDNAMAERVNGILKGEYLFASHLMSQSQVRVAVRQTIHLYNTQRPHMSLGLATPEEVHQNPHHRPPKSAPVKRAAKPPQPAFEGSPERTVSEFCENRG